MSRTNTSAAKAAAPIEEAEEKMPMKPKEVDVHQYIPVINGFHGTLCYVSRRTGETFVWGSFGEEQEMELQELKNAKSSEKLFFQNNWFMFPEEYTWVIDYLGVRQFYKNALKPEDFDKLFTKQPAEIKKIVSGMSDGQKGSLHYRVLELLAEDGIDSRKVIAALEEALGVQLVEK